MISGGIKVIFFANIPLISKVNFYWQSQTILQGVNLHENGISKQYRSSTSDLSQRFVNKKFTTNFRILAEKNFKLLQVRNQKGIEKSFKCFLIANFEKTMHIFLSTLMTLYIILFYIFLINLRIQSEHRKIRTRKNSVFGFFSRSDYYHYYKCIIKINIFPFN